MDDSTALHISHITQFKQHTKAELTGLFVNVDGAVHLIQNDTD